MAFSRRQRDHMVAKLQSGHKLTNRERSVLHTEALKPRHGDAAQALTLWEQLAADRVSRIVAMLEGN